MTGIRILKISDLPAPDSRLVVDVFAEDGKLVCYCGPYNREQAITCLDLFRQGGWHVNDTVKKVM